jgi:hypothetical protein
MSSNTQVILFLAKYVQKRFIMCLCLRAKLTYETQIAFKYMKNYWFDETVRNQQMLGLVNGLPSMNNN